jgi:RNA polymerase sigma-70 factor (ECF subfamily)
MAEAPPTRPSLLLRIRNAQDKEAWSQFVEVYAPLVYGFVRKRGIQEADAADLTQDVLRTVAVAAGRLEYDPQKGSFRGWLFTVTRNKLRNFLADQLRQCRGTGGTSAQHLLEAQQGRDEDEARTWDQEYEQRLFAWAADQVRDKFQESTWRAFWQTAVEGQSAKTVAERFGLSVGAVYIARSRVLARLREQIESLHDE